MVGHASNAVLELRGVCQAFPKPSGAPLVVLESIDIALRDGEILGLLGRSGSGKSTVLRIASGLLAPTSGQVLYRGAPLTGPAAGLAMVFQTFALFPWLTVVDNVELGLAALGLGREETRRRALAAIELIGLDGFQSAYPRELSGGMRQRVGFARALVTAPTVLLMDEPFSELDVLTAETLRTDFLDLWVARQLSTKAVILVTHNIEEAVLMCDRILVLSSHPGRVAAEIAVPLPQPRNRLDPEFHRIVDEIYSVLTARVTDTAGARGRAHAGVGQPLPAVPLSRIVGLVETVAGRPYDGQAELADLDGPVALERGGLLAVAEALRLLEFAELKGGAIRLTAAGRVFAQAGPEARKQLFQEHLLRFVPLAAHICRVLEERPGHRAPRVRFESELEDRLPRASAERTLQTVTGWGRYAELFGYDDKTRTFLASREASDVHARG